MAKAETVGTVHTISFKKQEQAVNSFISVRNIIDRNKDRQD